MWIKDNKHSWHIFGVNKKMVNIKHPVEWIDKQTIKLILDINSKLNDVSPRITTVGFFMHDYWYWLRCMMDENRRGGLRFRLSHSWDTALHGVPSCISASTNNCAWRSLVVVGKTPLSFELMSSISFILFVCLWR